MSGDPLSSYLNLADLLGDESVVRPEQLHRYAVDGLVPQVVVRPADRDGVAQALRWASTEGRAVFPRGGGTQLCLGNVPSRIDLVLDLSRCNRLLDYQPADMTATVEAGITLESLQQELAAKGQFVPLEAPLPERSTIGGILAANASGPLRSTYGLARDWLIGIGVASAAGVRTKAGGKVVKNVTGYDLNKLYTGSLGTLGVIMEATFKLAPLPPAWGALRAVFPSLQEGVGAARGLLSRVTAAQGVAVINRPVARRLDQVPPLGEGEALAVAFYSGRSRAVERRLNEGVRWLREKGAAQVEPLDSAGSHHLLRALTDLGWTAETRPYLGLQVNVPPSAVGDVVAWTQEPGPLGGWDTGVIADVAFGRVHLLWWAEGASEGPDERAVMEAIHRMRGSARGLSGWMLVEHCPLPVKR
ncbi:MAG: FAD-binding oxidoreductase, partial [Chloroflexota bacterium]